MDNQAAPLARCLAAVDAHKLDDVRSCYAPDAAIVGPGVELHGSDQIIPWYQVFVTAFPDLRHEIRGTVQEGDACAVEVRVSGTHTGPLASPAGPIAPTGRRFAIDYVDIAHFENGRIKRESLYWDNQSFLTQLGLV
jgi:steroid delta-isomerase-like uncharacterized protein